jgi:hypothetical protein
VIPQPLVLNRLTVGKHTQAIALQDSAGNALKYTNTFLVTTSFRRPRDRHRSARDERAPYDAERRDRRRRDRRPAPGAVRVPGRQTIVIDSGAKRDGRSRSPEPAPTLNTTLTQPAAAGATGIRVATINQATIAARGSSSEPAPTRSCCPKQVITPAPAIRSRRTSSSRIRWPTATRPGRRRRS